MKARVLVTIAGLAAAASVGGAVAYAAIPSSNGTITGCYTKSVTDVGHPAPLFILDAAKGGCPAGFTTLTWNQGAPPTTPVITQRFGDKFIVTPQHSNSGHANCLAGEIATGGGYQETQADGTGTAYDLQVGSSRPVDPITWFVQAFNPLDAVTMDNEAIIPWVQCLKL